MYEYTIKQFSDLIVENLEKLQNNKNEVILQNPDTQSKFPCTVVRTPIETILSREDNIPIRKRFSISIEEWADKQAMCMNRLSQTELKLREYNILKTSNDISFKDSITDKYRIINTYETIYNGLTNSFELVR